MPHLRKRTIQELSPLFPTTLAEFDQSVWQQTLSHNVSTEEIENMISTIEETGVLKFLPAIKYCLCTRVPFLNLHRGNPAPSTFRSVVDAIPSLIIGQFRISHMTVSETCSDLKSGCSYSNSCSARIEIIFRESLLIERLDPLSSTPLYKKDKTRSPPEGSLCSACSTACDESFQNNRDRLWKDLPGIFGLPPWNELLKGE